MNKIVCPYCGAEYLPSEIFMPQDMLDKSYIIHKTKEGKIEAFEGEGADLIATYTCDVCDKTFVVEADIKYTAKKEDVEEEYVTRL